MQRGLREGILAGKVAPVVCCSATKLLGGRTLMSTINELLPPAEGDPTKPAKAVVFSTGGDHFGRVRYFKVVAGHVKTPHHPPPPAPGPARQDGLPVLPRRVAPL